MSPWRRSSELTRLELRASRRCARRKETYRRWKRLIRSTRRDLCLLSSARLSGRPIGSANQRQWNRRTARAILPRSTSPMIELTSAQLLARYLAGDRKFSQVKLTSTGLVDADLTCIELRASHLQGADLRGARLNRADLTMARLVDADLSGADLTGADASNADFTRAKLDSAKFARANLSGANFGGADLSNSGLMGADLTGANFKEAIHW
jgi:uncharacterized protein YjbI with pentapeptide repeats